MKFRKGVIVALTLVGILLIATGLYITNMKRTVAINTFRFIPEKPDDFEAVKREAYAGTISMCNVDEEYYKQPEFYPSWKNAKRMYEEYSWSHWGRHGYTAFPLSMTYDVENMKKGDEINLCSFFANGWAVWTWQGFKLKPVENEFFSIDITPDLFVLDPTYPIVGDDYIKKITLKITAKQDIPLGTYEVGFTDESPSDYFNKKQTELTLAQQVKDKPLWIEKCTEITSDKEKCTELVNRREKSYSVGGKWKTENLPLTVVINAK